MKILVGISGGVDSSVAALLLREAGHEVEGVMFNQVEEPEYSCEGNVCCGENAVSRARQVANQLNIHLHVVDLRAEFKKKIIQPTQAYLDTGAQPAPCNACNREIRGPQLAKYAKVLECDAFATGHYFQNINGEIFRGIDEAKDQSYMVSRVEGKVLKNWLAPLGGMLKSQVREHATRFGLVTAATPDSMNLCFAHKLNHKVRDVYCDYSKKSLGVHSASVAVGQRKGLHGYTALRVLSDSVVVFPGKVDCKKSNFELEAFNWISEPTDDCRMLAMTSSHGKMIPFALNGNNMHLLEPSLSAIGQVVAFYDGERLLGSAIVKDSF